MMHVKVVIIYTDHENLLLTRILTKNNRQISNIKENQQRYDLKGTD